MKKKVYYYLDIIQIFLNFTSEIKEKLNMTTSGKYTVGASGSGWGIWDANGNKVFSFTGRSIGRIEALRYLYYLNGWDWSRSKYVRESPYLKDFRIWEGYGLNITY